MRKITILIDEKTEKKFFHMLTLRGKNSNWQKIPTYKDMMVEAINLLYEKQEELEKQKKALRV